MGQTGQQYEVANISCGIFVTVFHQAITQSSNQATSNQPICLYLETNQTGACAEDTKQFVLSLHHMTPANTNKDQYWVIQERVMIQDVYLANYKVLYQLKKPPANSNKDQYCVIKVRGGFGAEKASWMGSLDISGAETLEISSRQL